MIREGKKRVDIPNLAMSPWFWRAGAASSVGPRPGSGQVLGCAGQVAGARQSADVLQILRVPDSSIPRLRIVNRMEPCGTPHRAKTEPCGTPTPCGLGVVCLEVNSGLVEC